MCNLTVLSLMPNLRARTLLLAPVADNKSIMSFSLLVKLIIINSFFRINDMQNIRSCVYVYLYLCIDANTQIKKGQRTYNTDPNYL
jgi:hypothetical protein